MALKNSLSRMIRCGAAALISVIVYMRRSMVSVDYISTAMKEHTPSTLLKDQLERLDRMPKDSVHRVAFVTFSYVKPDDASRLFEFILPAVDTWAAPTGSIFNISSAADDDDYGGENGTYVIDSITQPALYVVFTQTSREPYERICIYGEGNITDDQYALCHRIQPIYVDCPERKFGESPCCKQQFGLLELFQSRNYPLYDWYAFFDDDTYLRKEYIARVFSAMEFDPEFPMSAVPYSQESKPIGFGKYTCAKDDKEFLYPWGQPIFYSRGAMSMMAGGYRAQSLQRQCAEFKVTHDMGNAMLNWMYSLPVARMPPLNPLPHFRKDFIGNHWVGRDDMRRIHFGEKKTDRRGRFTKALSEGSFSFYNTHKRWMLRQNHHPNVAGLASVTREELKWYPNVTGFRQTLTYSRHGDPQSWKAGQWHAMTVADCNIWQE